MKALSIKSLSAVLGALALIAILFSVKSQAQQVDCEKPLGDLQLNERQAKDYQQLEAQYEADLAKAGEEYERHLEAILPINSTQQYEDLDAKKKAEFDAATDRNQERVGAVQATFDRGIKQILNPEQRQQFERWNASCNFADT